MGYTQGEGLTGPSPTTDSLASRRIGKVVKGKRLGGHYGNSRHTSKNLVVLRIDEARNLLYLKGTIAGPTNGFVQVCKARTPKIKKG